MLISHFIRETRHPQDVPNIVASICIHCKSIFHLFISKMSVKSATDTENTDLTAAERHITQTSAVLSGLTKPI